MANSTESSWSLYKRLLNYVTPYWRAFALSFLGYAIYGATQVGLVSIFEYLPAIFGQSQDISGFIDYIYPLESPEQLRNALPIIIVILAIFRGFGSYLGGFYIVKVGRNLIDKVRKDLFTHLTLLPGSFFAATGSSSSISLITYNVEQLSAAATDAVRTLLREGLTILGLLTFLFTKNWKLTLVFLMVSPLIGAVVSLASSLLRKYSRRIQNSMGSLTRITSESIKGLADVKNYGAQNYERQRFAQASSVNLLQSLKLARVTEISAPFIQVLTFSSLALLFWIGLQPELKGDMDTGDFLAYVAAAAMIARPLRQLTSINTAIQRGLAAAQSIFDVLDETPEEDSGTRELANVRGHIEFKNLDFYYPDSTEPALQRINLEIQPGTTVALVGRSGSGKTTLATLMTRHGISTSGELLIDGHPIEEYRLASLRSNIATVSQNIVLFDNTARANIAYGELAEASDEAISSAVKFAHAEEFIQQLPQGLNTPIGENGTSLSGGQRQRIALARAFLKDAPILIMDEATSALDNQSESHIQGALQEIMKNRTNIVIAHRMSTIESADMIVVLENGKIVETGTHSELITKEGAYTQLYRSQFREQS